MRLDRLNIQSINPQSSDNLNFFWGSSPGLTREVFEMVFFDIEEIGGVDGFVLLSGATWPQNRHKVTKLIRNASNNEKLSRSRRIIQD